ncbi:hypothetical protein [Brevundimonas aveniformis]|uniref:hypothetical protein n=1 Tax=Brevundimonas aveniformis TaxID=370977 RepID=UPI0024903943|nr:hypothetical protein [Brevundimonas aveniformis]
MLDVTSSGVAGVQRGVHVVSQHNIVGSEAFGRRPHVYIRTLRRGAYHRRRGRLIAAFVAGVVVAIAGLAALGLGWGTQIGG